ncbi:rubredoxin [Prescottella agglutinans]|uniref:Rubredoxin n=1 Tax=Prescottella agglutinans TaxID=1644129 RepID=A0ABT6MJR9_9NOCA|nr:rubredoxin [Prescottella agglutinans]
MNRLDGAGAKRLATARTDSGRTKVDGHERIANDSLRVALSTHLPNTDRTTCTACGFVYTIKTPLCPVAADALRELSTGKARPQSRSPLNCYPTGRLRAMACEHGGEGRCRRCGFVYTAEVRICPTARRIDSELEVRGKSPVTQPRTGQGLCAGKGHGWTVSGKEPTPWKRALSACKACPLLAQCESLLNSRLAAGDKIVEQVMAGRLFSVTGREIASDKIDAFAIARGRPKKRPVSRKPKRSRGALPGTRPVPASEEAAA